MITHSPPEVKSGPINRAILLPPAMPPPAASTSHHPASQCRPSGGEAIPPRQPMPAKAGEARTHPRPPPTANAALRATRPASQNFAPSGAKQISIELKSRGIQQNSALFGGALPRRKHLSRSGVCESPPVRRLVGLSSRSEAPVSIARPFGPGRGPSLALKGRRGLSMPA